LERRREGKKGWKLIELKAGWTRVFGGMKRESELGLRPKDDNGFPGILRESAQKKKNNDGQGGQKEIDKRRNRLGVEQDTKLQREGEYGQ